MKFPARAIKIPCSIFCASSGIPGDPEILFHHRRRHAKPGRRLGKQIPALRIDKAGHLVHQAGAD
jgi:hypothetical protein